MFQTDDTIVAVATPPGRSGIGLVRLSGPAAHAIAGTLIGRTRPLRPRLATFARLASAPAATGRAVSDQVVVTAYRRPRSATGDDVVEISAHGSPVVLESILQAAIGAGARLAAPGEFTLRAYLNGKLDLVQAEAIGDLIAAVTPRQARAAFDQLEGTLTTAIGAIERDLFDLRARLEASLDFPDEGYHFVDMTRTAAEIQAIRGRIDQLLSGAARGRMIREGVHVAIIGTPNVGKSSLFNALLDVNRAIVTDMPGTTRDLLTERLDIRGFPASLVDTAGIRVPTDAVEEEGIARARQAAAVADVTLLVLDGSRPMSEADRALVEMAAARRIIAINKADLPQRIESLPAGETPVAVSARTRAGIEAVVDRLAMLLGGVEDDRDSPLVGNVRHIALLERARASLDRAIDALASGAASSEEFVLADLHDVDMQLQEITGRRTTEDLLRHIFERFCIGK
jgi:tRNA modification GTPase